MEVRYGADRVRYQRMTAAELRENFWVGGLFAPGALRLLYCETERAVVGGAVPAGKPLALEAGPELAAEYFCERREAGVLNIGGAGRVRVDDAEYGMDRLDCLYLARGSRAVTFASVDPDKPARFYILSYPAHKRLETRHAKKSAAEPVRLGSPAEANVRTIHKYIHPDGIKSCQLVMGFTTLEPGSVWNTMPAHTHERRTEVYMYFDIPEKAVVFHLMGPADETRHLVMRDGEVAISPMWSIHSGVGTAAYSFCWGMGGENQVFNDMDPAAMSALK